MKDSSAQSGGKRLQTILDLLNISAFKLAKLTGVTPAAIYHVIGGSNNLSDALIEKIVRRFDDISYAYLKSGKGEPILQTKVERRSQHNRFLLPGEKLNEEDKIEKSVSGDNNLFRQVQELIYQQKKSNDFLQVLVQENIEIKELLIRYSK
jgi:transcriptional regulator with XRE-family HTH domain